MSRKPSSRTVHVTVPIIVAIIGLIATIAAAIIGLSGGRKQELTNTVELLAEKFDSVDSKMSYEQALQVIYESSQKMREENKNLADENKNLANDIKSLNDEITYLNNDLSTLREQLNNEEKNRFIIESAKSYADVEDYLNALSLLKGISKKTTEIEIFITDYTEKYLKQITSEADLLAAEGKYGDATSILNEGLKIVPKNEKLTAKLTEITSSMPTSLSKAKVIDSVQYKYHGELFKDNFGNEYFESFSLEVTGWMGGKDIGYVVYNVENYSKFYAEVVCGDYTNSSTTFIISVFIDDDTAPVKVISEYTKQTGKKTISIDIKNATKIKVTCDGSGFSSGIRLVNATLSN